MCTECVDDHYHLLKYVYSNVFLYYCRGRLGHDRIVVAVTTTPAISAHQHQIYKFKYRSLQGVLDTTLCDKVG